MHWKITEQMSFFPYSSVSSRPSCTTWWPRRPTPSRSRTKSNGPCVRCTGSWGYAWGCRGPRSSGTTGTAGIGRVCTRSSRPSSSTRQWSGRRSTWTTRQADRPYPRPSRPRDPDPGFFTRRPVFFSVTIRKCLFICDQPKRQKFFESTSAGNDDKPTDFSRKSS